MDNFRLFAECSLIVCAAIRANVIQSLVDHLHCLFGDFLEWNDDFSMAVEGYHVNPGANWLLLDGFAIAFSVYDFYELFACIDCMLNLFSLH